LRTGAVVVVHTSYRAIAPIEGGPSGLVSALRLAVGPEGTIVMPSWGDDDDVPFDPSSTSCRAMGVVADAFWRRPGVVRSDNPASFAAEGPLARAIAAPHPIAPPHGIDSPVGRVAALGGFVLLLGVGHDADTTIHLAESLAHVPYRARKHCTVLKDGAPVRIEYDETDHCCAKFARMDGWLRAQTLQAEGPVGSGTARLARSSDVVRTAVGELERDPFAFLHGRGEGCAECEAAWASVA
jgi:aminoglycoside N3'-acetyltransferase